MGLQGPLNFALCLNLLSHVSGHVSPALAIASTPPVEKPKAKPRKRKQKFDESLGLPNKYG